MTLQKEILFVPDADASDEKQRLLKNYFPECFDKNGVFLPEKLAESLNAGGVRAAKEFYSLNWLGKSYAKVLRDVPPKTLLAEDTAHNRQPENENSGHLLIKGDNLEVLKHLKNAYKEAVKMIYIDPPYNTGSDGFVYQDDRKFTPEQLAELGSMDLDEAQRVLDFTAKKSNSHSAWLTFMYPRLYIARQLLRDDGVIFISIDDNEQAQLKLLCDEVFGEENFIGAISWESKTKSQNTKDSFDKLQPKTEYIWLYTKRFCRRFNLKVIGEKSYPENDDNGVFRYAPVEMMNASGVRGRSSMVFPIFNVYPRDGMQWKVGQELVNNFLARNDVILKDGQPILKIRPDDERSEVAEPFWGFLSKEIGTAESAKKELTEILNGKHGFDTVKPIDLIKKLIFHSSKLSTDLILDFFAGSGTTAHAVMQLNAEDVKNGIAANRRYICVQLPEATDPKSEARKAGYQTIFDITQARIEKASAKIRQDFPNFNGDLGFKIFETVPDFRAAAAADFDPSQADLPLLQDAALSERDLNTLLTTWRVYDGQRPSENVQTIDLAGFPATLCGKHLYLLHTGFHSGSVKALIECLDNDEAFTPERIVLYGANMDSAMQRELAQAVESYANKKSLNISVLARY